MHTGENSKILTVSKKIVIEIYGRQKKFCMQLVSKVPIFFYSGDLRTRFARVANFPSRKKSNGPSNKIIFRVGVDDVLILLTV
jgi:hypothetical protein